jgi:ribokinase
VGVFVNKSNQPVGGLMDGHIIVVGSLNMDMVVRTTRHPKVGETILGNDFRTFPGGKGANQAVTAAKLGHPVKMVGRVGQDPFGDQLLMAVANSGVDTTYIYRDSKAATGVALITVDELGQNTIVVASGANGRLSPDDVQAAEDVFAGASVLLLQLECPLNAIEYAIQLARKNRVQVILNPAPAQILDAELLESVDYLIPNQTELALLAGQESVQSAIGVLRTHGVKCIVVTLGERGALIVEQWNEVLIPTFNVPVVDTTAAGDAFAGAFAVALSEGLSIYGATRWGNAAGALTVMKAGAQPSLPSREEFNAFLTAYTLPE